MQDKSLYVRQCDRSGQEMLSVYPPTDDVKVIEKDVYDRELFG